MSTAVDQGNQEIFPDFDQELDSDIVSRRFSDVVPPGIYEGLEPTIISSTEVSIAAGLFEIQDPNKNQIKIRTNNDVVLTPTETEPYMVIRWNWNNEEDWYADFLADDFFVSTDLLLGKALFDNNGNLNGVDLENRSRPRYLGNVEFEGNVSFFGAKHESLTKIATSSYTVQKNDFIIGVNQLPTTISLPLQKTGDRTRKVIISDEVGNASTDPITVEAQGSNDIDGSSQDVINTDFGRKAYYFDRDSSWRPLEL